MTPVIRRFSSRQSFAADTPPAFMPTCLEIITVSRRIAKCWNGSIRTGDGILTPDEKQRARIVIYGHSWGASETVALARELEHRKIPVMLTIQVDSIGKPGEHDGLIPPNVANAVNFYQPHGLFHGRPEIAAADPARTRIIGNVRMTYNDHPITSGSSSWFARLFMKSHIQIEDDPHIWQQIAALIDWQISQSRSIGQAQASRLSAVGP